uniref:Uncharacterized protein n=1 Tax=Oryza brachyantha TaxID=4533 RepID=J3N9W4_ORYBR
MEANGGGCEGQRWPCGLDGRDGRGGRHRGHQSGATAARRAGVLVFLVSGDGESMLPRLLVSDSPCIIVRGVEAPSRDGDPLGTGPGMNLALILLSGPGRGFDPVVAPIILEVVTEVPRGSEQGKWQPPLNILIP